MKNPALKYILKKQSAGDVVHTSAFAKAQTGTSFGAGSHESFSQRLKRENERKFVGGYHGSHAAKGTVPVRGVSGGSHQIKKK